MFLSTNLVQQTLQLFISCNVLIIVGFKIKRGWNINIDARSIHLDPMVYNDPNKFSPQRFDVSFSVAKSIFFSIFHQSNKRIKNFSKCNVIKQTQFYEVFFFPFCHSTGRVKTIQVLSFWNGREDLSGDEHGQSDDASIPPPFNNHIQVIFLLYYQTSLFLLIGICIRIHSQCVKAKIIINFIISSLQTYMTIL